MENKYTMKLISNRTGLSPQLIRTWEKRYGAIIPERTETKRRLYSEKDLEKLLLLKRATSMGLAISTIAGLTIEELYKLVDKRDINKENREMISNVDDATEYHLQSCLKAIDSFDYNGLESALLNASSSLGQNQFIEKVITPLMEQTGINWLNGDYQISQEHMVSTIVRSILGNILVSGSINSGGPILLATTPSRQQHELGVLISAITALSLGWQVIYLGSNLPVEEIANASLRHHADVVTLGITYPVSDSLLHNDLQRLRKILGPDKDIYIGGQGASSFIETISSINAYHIKDLNHLREMLGKKKLTIKF